MFLECVGTEIRSPMIWSKFILYLEETPLNPDQPDSYGHNYSLSLEVCQWIRERRTVTAALKQEQFVDTRLLVDTTECPYL